MTVHMTFNDTDEYNLRSITILGCNISSQITVAQVTLPKAVLGTAKLLLCRAFQIGLSVRTNLANIMMLTL